ncbi:hypothetical protein CUROG_04580 [Corynebacterium urogenitale]|uniref:Bacteriophage T5 Orf172 DNA-binding domain-containing protein n=1 Tax=Corynebacterium urogenitale TaxID=2487892 RepID=A0A5J6Z7D6_9CORY|nr:DUF4041 domain-containing protein [Corynebacterium urogenitale]QFQ02291.1 hypothetical protein CUROG_04580 [Corynebacterium urogenitale]
MEKVVFGRSAKKENEQLQGYVAQLQAQIASMEQFIQSIGAGDVAQLEQVKNQKLFELQNLDNQRQQLEREVGELGDRKRKVELEAEDLRKQMVDAREEITLQGFGLYDYENPAEESMRLADELDSVKDEIKQTVKDKKAVSATTGFTYNNSIAKGKSFVNKLSKLALRSYNAEVENAVTRLKAGNIQAAEKRLERARNEVQRMGDMISLQITPEYHRLRLLELQLAYQHLQAKKAAKEAEREEKARLREEKKAQQEMEAERKRLQKEESHYLNAITKLQSEGRTSEIEELEFKLEEIRKGIDDVDYRAANIRAGYVYVISNIGSFGGNIVKIGMTRRLDPMDRVRELGDASVPFNFDVHALHFSEDAVGVEAALHRHFEKAKVNLVNNRREFFYATPAEVKEVLSRIEGNVLEYRDEAEAEQFKLSQAMREDL